MQLKKQRQESLDRETRSYLEQLTGREAEIQELEKRRQRAVRSRNINLKWVQGTTGWLQLPCSCHLLHWGRLRLPPGGRQEQERVLHCKGPVSMQPRALSPQVCLQENCRSHSGLQSGPRRVNLLRFVACAALQVLTLRLREGRCLVW